jgi:hypothetical protein
MDALVAGEVARIRHLLYAPAEPTPEFLAVLEKRAHELAETLVRRAALFAGDRREIGAADVDNAWNTVQLDRL